MGTVVDVSSFKCPKCHVTLELERFDMPGDEVECPFCEAFIVIPGVHGSADAEVVKDNRGAPQYKECPFCAELILFKAVKCKHCGEFLEKTPSANNSSVFFGKTQIGESGQGAGRKDGFKNTLPVQKSSILYKDLPINGGCFMIISFIILGAIIWVAGHEPDRDYSRRGTKSSSHPSTPHLSETTFPDDLDSRLVTSPDAVSDAKTYRIASSKDMSYHDPQSMQHIRRTEYRVQLEKELSEAGIKAVAEDIISQNPAVDAIVIFFYLPESEPTGAYTAGKATYAPTSLTELSVRPKT